MQPYFFPYLGYFDLINYSDKWIVFDSAQYIRHGWVNRNRILHPKSEWQYIIVPIRKHPRETQIKDIEIKIESDWKSRILGQLLHYKKRAPYFETVFSFVEDCLSLSERSISRLNAYILEKVCNIIGIRFRYDFFSEMNLDIGSVKGPGDWALRISEALGADEYVNPPGGETIFDPSRFEDLGIKLTLRNLPTFQYDCRGYEFIPNLSIIDVLMWNTTETVKDYLDRHKA